MGSGPWTIAAKCRPFIRGHIKGQNRREVASEDKQRARRNHDACYGVTPWKSGRGTLARNSLRMLSVPRRVASFDEIHPQ